MTTAVTRSPSKTTKRPEGKSVTRTAKKSTSTLCGQVLTGAALLADMNAYRQEITATPDTARNFLVRLGVMTKSGKTKKLIRG